MSHLHLKTYKSHESVREQNKREQRRFDLTSDGRYNEYKFKLNGINKQQRLVEKDLEKIRSGVHRPPNSAFASSHKQFNTEGVRSLTERNLRKKQEKNSPKRSPRPRRKSDEVEIDTDMLVEYLQKLQDANVIDIDNDVTDKVNTTTQLVNQSLTPDLRMSQSPAHQAERSGSFNNKQVNLPIIDDINSQSRGSSDIKQDLILKAKTPSPNQRNLKSSPVEIMGTPESGVILEKEHNNSPKPLKDMDMKYPENSKGNDIFSHKKSAQEDVNHMKQMYFDTNSDFGPRKHIPNSDKQWEQARRARYVRTREPLERDRELSVKEIFDQIGNRK